MLNDYFGEAGDGRIGRGRFLLLLIGLIVGFLAVGLGISAALGLSTQILVGDPMEIHANLTATLGVPFMVGLAVLVFLFMFAHLNIVAKRARDGGLPGWGIAILYLILAGLQPVCLLLLLLLPPNAFAQNKQTP